MKTTTVRTRTTIKVWAAILLAASLALAGCGSDDGSGGDSSESGAEAGADSDNAGDDSSGGGDAGPAPSGGTIIFGGEEISMERLFCFFEEQPRAGLGGIFTHTAQAEGTNAAGEAVLLDTTRAVAEDGTVEFDLSFGVGDPFGDDYIEYADTGQEIMFGDNSVSSTGDVNDFDAGLVTLTFDLPCG